jgi:hypothetical protein
MTVGDHTHSTIGNPRDGPPPASRSSVVRPSDTEKLQTSSLRACVEGFMRAKTVKGLLMGVNSVKKSSDQQKKLARKRKALFKEAEGSAGAQLWVQLRPVVGVQPSLLVNGRW